MQTSKNHTKTREDIESAIEDCKGTIDKHSYRLRWFTLGVYIFWLGLATSIVSLAILLPLNILILQPILGSIGGISIVVSIIAGIGIMVAYFPDAGINMQGVLRELRNEKQNLSMLSRRLKYYDEQVIKHLPPIEQHIHQLPILIVSYRKRADRYRWWFIVTQIITIFLSAIITSLSGGWLDKYISAPWIIPVFSALISILTSLTLFFKFREKGSNLQQTADAMDLEYRA